MTQTAMTWTRTRIRWTRIWHVDSVSESWNLGRADNRLFQRIHLLAVTGSTVLPQVWLLKVYLTVEEFLCIH